MNRKLDRAKQFANGFDPLKGYALELRRRERLVVEVEKKELSEDKKQMLDIALNDAKEGQIITVIYFDNGEYVKVTGILSKKDLENKYIKIVNTKIHLTDVYDISLE